MILTCPSCGTQYAVKDGAIPAGGRKVRCATCGHSWHQQADEAAPTGAPEEGGAKEQFGTADRGAPPGGSPDAFETIPPDPPGAPLVEAPAAIPVPPPENSPAPSFAPDEPVDQWELDNEIPDAEEIEAVESETGADRKRTWIMGILLAILLVTAIALALWFFAPDSLRRQVGFAAAPSPLQIAPGTPERQTLASGNELVVVSGRVINPSSRAQQVPPIEAQLRDKSGRVLYTWTIAPPARSLPPGGSATFNSAEMGVPPSGLDSTVTLTLKS